MPVSGSALRGGNKQSYLVLQCAGLVTPMLLSDQLSNRNIEFQGALAANLAITFGLSFEDQGLQWTLLNNCSGAFSLTVQASAGAATPYAIPQGARTDVLWDGNNLVPKEIGLMVRTDQLVITGITGVSPTTILTNAQAAFTTIVLQGNATASPVLQLPSRVGTYLIVNETAGNVIVKNAAGTGMTVNSGTSGWAWDDGTNVSAVA